MRVKQSTLMCLYYEPTKIVPAIEKINKLMVEAKKANNALGYSVYKRLRGWITKGYSVQGSTMKGGVCDEWLQDPTLLKKKVEQLMTEQHIPFDEISKVTICRFDPSALFDDQNIYIKLQKAYTNEPLTIT